MASIINGIAHLTPEINRVDIDFRLTQEAPRPDHPGKQETSQANWEKTYQDSLEPTLFKHSYVRHLFGLEGTRGDGIMRQLARQMSQNPKRVAKLLLALPEHPPAKRPEDAFQFSRHQHGQAHIFDTGWYTNQPKFIALDRKLLSAPFFRGVIAHGLNDASARQMLSSMPLQEKKHVYRTVVNAQLNSLPDTTNPMDQTFWIPLK